MEEAKRFSLAGSSDAGVPRHRGIGRSDSLLSASLFKLRRWISNPSLPQYLNPFPQVRLTTQLTFVALTASVLMGWCGELETHQQNPGYVLIKSACSEAKTYQALITGGFILGAASGSLLSGPLMSAVGRRVSLLCIYSGIILAAFLGCISRSFSQLLLSRILSGLLSGVATIVPSVFLTEMMPAASSPIFSLLPQVAVNLGILLGICAGFPLRLTTAEPSFMKSGDWKFNQIWWRFMILIPSPFAAVAALLLKKYLVFDTPIYLRAMGEPKAAKTVEHFLSNASDGMRSMASTPSNQSSAKSTPQGGLRPGCRNENTHAAKNAIFPSKFSQAATFNTEATEAVEPNNLSLLYALKSSSKIRKRLLISWSFAILQQLTGINVFVAGSNAVFAAAGVSSGQLTLASASMAFLGFLGSCIAPFLIERSSRRALLIVGGASMTAALLPAWLCTFIVSPSNPISQMASVFSTLAFVVSYAMTYGPGLFLYLNELVPAEVKDTALAVAFALNWLTCFIVICVTPSFSQAQSFSIFIGVCTICTMFGMFLAPETRSLPTEFSAVENTSMMELQVIAEDINSNGSIASHLA